MAHYPVGYGLDAPLGHPVQSDFADPLSDSSFRVDKVAKEPGPDHSLAGCARSLAMIGLERVFEICGGGVLIQAVEKVDETLTIQHSLDCALTSKRENLMTSVAQENDALGVPGLKELLFKYHGRDELLGSGADNIADGAAERCGKMANVVQHCVGLVGSPLPEPTHASREACAWVRFNLTAVAPRDSVAVDRCQPDRKASVTKEHELEPRVLVLRDWNDGWVKGFGHAENTQMSELHGLLIVCGKFVLLFQATIYAFAYTTIRTISSHKDIALVLGTILADAGDTRVTLDKVNDLLTELDLVGGNARLEELKEGRSSHNIGVVAVVLLAKRKINLTNGGEVIVLDVEASDGFGDLLNIVPETELFQESKGTSIEGDGAAKSF